MAMTQTKRLLIKLENESQIEREEQCRKRLSAYVHYKPKAKSRAEVKRSKLCELRKKNDAMRCELDINRELEQEAKRNEEARLALYRSNMTPEQKLEREENNRIMATWASGICAEAALTWRQDAQAAFDSKKL
jgi:hypothetical protein